MVSSIHHDLLKTRLSHSHCLIKAIIVTASKGCREKMAERKQQEPKEEAREADLPSL